MLGYLCNPLRITLWYTSGYFPCYAIPKRWRPRWRHFAVLLTSEAHKRSEKTRSSSYLHTNSPDTCTVKNACGFTACYPENLLSYLAHARAVDTRPSFLLGTRLVKDGLWSIVNGTEAIPDEGDADARAKFVTRRDRALALIVLSVEPSLIYLLEDPVVVWKKLSDQFQKKTWAIMNPSSSGTAPGIPVILCCVCVQLCHNTQRTKRWTLVLREKQQSQQEV